MGLLFRHAATCPVERIPGPPKHPELGTFQDLIDRNGGAMDGLDINMKRFQSDYYKEFGGVVAHSQPGLGDYLTVHEPTDFIQLYRSEGPYPAGIIQQVWAIKQYLDLRGQQQIAGYFSQGEEWKRLRSALAADLMQPKAARAYLPVINRAVEESCQALEDYEGNMDEFVTLMAFDMFSAVCLGSIMGSANRSMAKPVNLKFVDDAQLAFSAIGKMFNSGVQAGDQTHPLWFKFVAAMDDAQERGAQLVTEVLEALESGTADDLQKQSYVAKLVDRDELSKEEMVQIMMLLLQAGVDTTAHVTNWLLINIASNPQVQDKLRAEIQSVCPAGDVTEEHLKQMPYLKACMRESHRLTPALTMGTVRPAPTDMVMAGYKIPEGTLIMTNNHCIQNDPNLVENVTAFLPERWSDAAVQARKDTDKAVCDHALLRDSFGMGARSCLGQRVAKLEIQVATARLVRDFKLELQAGQSWHTKMSPFLKADPFPNFHVSSLA